MHSKEQIFSSEELLRQAVAGLLERMPNIQNVRILHGSQEFGKDLVFATKGPFGERLLCAAVVKNSKITGAVDDNSGARAVFFQAEQALDTPIHDPALGHEERVQRVYIISPFPSSAQFIASIQGRLGKQFGQIIFITGEDLFALFKQYWPDFLIDELRALEAHLAEIETASLTQPLADVVQLYALGEVTALETRIYVDRSFRHILDVPEKLNSLSFELPSESRADASWSTDQLRVQVKRLEQRIGLVSHLVAWNFVSSSSAAEDSLTLLRECHELVSKAWSRMSDKNPVLQRLPAARALHPDEVALLKRWAVRARMLEDALFAPVRNAKSEAEQLPAGALKLDSLADQSVLRAARLSDCILTFSSFPIAGLCPGSRSSFPEKQLKEWGRSFVVSAPAGFGKTSYCRWNALLDAEAYRIGTSKVIPVYVALHRVRGQPLDSIETTFLKSGALSALLPNRTEDDSKIRIYLDGLDELPNDEERERVCSLARSATGPPLNAQVIITTRDYLKPPYLAWLPRLTLCELDDESQKVLIDRWLEKTSRSATALLEQLDRMDALKGIMGVPLLATLTVLVFRQTGSLPESKARLYSRFVELLSGGWDLAKGVLRPSKFGETVKIGVLCEVARRAHVQGLRTFSEDVLSRSVSAVLPGIATSDVAALITELLMDGLVVRTGINFYFSHHSFQEFLCARTFAGDPQSKEVERTMLLPFLKGDDWWREVVLFFVALVKGPARFANWFYQVALTPGSIPQRVDDVWTALEACYPGFTREAWLARRRGLGGDAGGS